MALAATLLDDIELSRLQPHQLVMKAGRLARMLDDDEARTWINWELNGYPNNTDAWEVMQRMGRADDSTKKGFFVRLSELSGLAAGQEQRVQASTGMSFGGEWGSIAAREHHKTIGAAAETVGQVRGIEGAVVAAVYEFVSRSYYELLFSDLQADLFTAAREEIDSRLSPMSGRTLEKIESISERLRAGDAEAVSQAMSTCRRLIDAAADALFAPREEPYMLGDQPLKVGTGNVLNRLQAFVAESGIFGPRRDRLRQTFSNLYQRTSAGTHAEVDVVEARYIFLQTYVALGELLALKVEVVAQSTEHEGAEGV
jgi:hypothetical protein